MMPAPPRGRTRRPERARHRARRSRVRAARLLRLRHRDAQHRRARGGWPALQPLPRHRALLADARRVADRPEPPRGRHGDAAGARGSVRGLHRPHPARRPRPSPGTCATTATRPTPSASGTWRRATNGARRVRSTGGRSGSASNGSTASSAATRTSGRRSSRPTTTRSNRRVVPTTATTSPRTSPTRRSACCRTSSKPRRASRSSPGSRPARCTHRIRSRRSGSSRTSASSTTAGTPGASACFARQVANGTVPPDTVLTPRPSWVAAWDALPTDQQRLLRAHDGGLRGLPRAHGSPDRSGHRTPARQRPARRHPDLPHLRQRDERRRRPVRIGERTPLRPRSRRRPGREPRAHRRPRRPPRVQPLRLGMGVGRQHAVAPVEAVRVARWRADAADRALAERHRGARRGARPVLPRDRSHADDPRRGRHRTARHRRRRRADADRRSLVARRVRVDAPRPRPARRSTSRCSAAARSTTTGGRRRPTTSAASSRWSARTSRAAASSTKTTGCCSTSPTTSPNRAISRPSIRSGCSSSSTSGGPRPNATTCCRSTTPSSGAPARCSGPPYGPRFRTVFKPGGGPVSEDVMPPLGAGYVVTARVDVGERAQGILFALGNWTNGCAWYLLDGTPRARVQRFRQRAPHRRRPSRFPRARTTSRTRTPAKAAAAPGSSRSTVARSAGASSRTTCRSAGRSAAPGSPSVRTGASRCATTTTVPFRFTGTLHDVTFAIPMLAPKDDTAARAELGIALKGE